MAARKTQYGQDTDLSMFNQVSATSDPVALITTSLSIDESGGTQNNGSGEAENNELTFAAGVLPAEFDAVLTVVAAGQGSPSVALSGYSTTSTSGVDVFSFGSNVTDVAFTDSAGAALDGDSSGLFTVDGVEIFLYTYAGDNNVLLARKGSLNDNGTPGVPGDDFYEADPGGEVVFAAYLDTATVAAGDANATGAKVWLVQYEPLYHDDPNDPDDAVSPDDIIYVTVNQLSNFSLAGAPSGQNLFLMFGDGTPDTGETTIVVTGKSPANQSEGESITTGDTVNTGQGGGGTTIGSNNQMLDPTEGLYFTFVTGANTNFTVPLLDQNEADVEANIDFTGLFAATGARFAVVQLQPPKAATLQVTALNTALETGVDFIDGLHDDTKADIDFLKVTTFTKVGKNVVQNTYEFTDDDNDLSTETKGDITVDFKSDGSVTITGVEATDLIEYQTSGTHNRVLIENIGNSDANYNAAFDIGGFSLTNAETTSTLFDILSFEDDGPTAAGTAVADAVDEDGLAGGITGGTGDLVIPNDDAPAPDGSEATTTGSVAGIFSAGTDGLGSYSLSNDTSGIKVFNTTPTEVVLTSKGDTVLYDVQSNVLWGFVDVGGTAGVYDNGTDRAVFKFEITDTGTGAYKFTLLDQLDHPDTVGGDNSENDLLLHLGTVLQVSDADGDTVTAAADKLVVTVDDDTPVVTAKSNLVYSNASNPSPGGTGIFEYAIGADERSTYSAASSDLIVTLTGGTVGSTSISDTNGANPPPHIVWNSETADYAVFDVYFTYVSNPSSGGTTDAHGTLTFDKVAGTYTLSLDAPIESFSILTTGTAQGFTGYAIGGTTPINQQPPVSVAELDDDFFVQFSSYYEPSGGTGVDNIKAGSTAISANNVFVNDSNELFFQAASWVSVSQSAAGVAGDTIQQGEVMDLDFFTYDPKGNTSAIPDARSSGVYLKFDGIGSEDLVVILKLVNPTDSTDTINRAFIVGNEDIIQVGSVIPNPPSYNITLDQNDGVVIFENNDFNFAGENYVIQGAQILVSTEGVIGQAYDLNGYTTTSDVSGDNDGATDSGDLLAFGDEDGEKTNKLESGEAGSWDGDVVKIIDLGFVTSVTPDAQLTFNVTVVDADGDTTSTQTLQVNLIGGDGLAASADPDTFAFSDADADGLLAMKMYNLTGGFLSGTDKLDFATAGAAANYAENLADATTVDAFIVAADAALTGSVMYYFGVVGSDGYLAFDGDANGITSVIQLVGVTNMAFGDII